MQTNKNAVVTVTGMTDKRRCAQDTFFLPDLRYCSVRSQPRNPTLLIFARSRIVAYILSLSQGFSINSQLGIQINYSWRFLSDQSLVVGQTKAAFLPGCLFWRSWGRSGGTARRWLRSLLRFEWWNLVADAGLSALSPRAPRSARRCHPLKASWVLSGEKSD